MQDIQVFISFPNFYQYFIQGFSKIAASLTSMLKTTRSLDLDPRELETDEVVRDGDKVDDKNPSKKSKNAKYRIQTHIGATGELTFLTPGAKKAFN